MEHFGSYEIVGLLGSGSAARVYEARSGTSRVALKVFDPGKHYEDRQLILAQFRNESEAIRNLDHRNIVKVIDAGISNDTPYIAMELLGRGSLESRLRSTGALSLPDVINAMALLADALDYAHGRGILHRDIKPSNILFDSNMRPVLSDFGVARFMPSRDETTASVGYDPPGTADFLAPEVLEEAPHSISSDIYAFGITTYMALTGRLPSDGRTLFTRSRDRVAGKLVLASSRNPNVPAGVSVVLARALAVHPRERFRSATDFIVALRAAARESDEQRLPNSTQKSSASVEQRKEGGWLDYWRYVVVPLAVAVIGAIAGWCG